MTTQITQPKPEETPEAPRNVQGQSLEQIVQLSIQCATEEQRIEREHNEALERENAAFQSITQETQKRREKRLAELAAGADQRQKEIQTQHDSKRQAVEAAHQAAQRQIARKKEETEAAIKKQVDQASWEAERVMVAAEMQVDNETQQAKHQQDASKGELASVAALEAAAQQVMGRYLAGMPAVDATIDEALGKRLVAERRAVLAEHRQQADALLKELRVITQPRPWGDLLRLTLIVLGMIGAAAAGWMLPSDSKTRLIAAGGGALAVLLVGMSVFIYYEVRNRRRVKAQAQAAYAPLKRALAIAGRAARFEAESGSAARKQRVKDARAKKERDVQAAGEQAKALQARAADRHRALLAEEATQYKTQLAETEKEKQTGLEKLKQERDGNLRQVEQDGTKATQDAQATHDATLAAIESKYETDGRALTSRWEDGLRAIQELLSAGSGIDPRLVDWNSPAWEQWKALTESTGQVRFGEMEVDLAQLTDHVPKRLKLPGTFSVPAMLALPAHASIILEADHSGRAACNEAAQMIMARLLTQMPAGRVKFTIFDPVGLGQGFAGFMHLVDHDESLVGSRIWTEAEHMQQRLADLTEHMETVIQKYLRNEFATIDEYNARAGELAEPYRFLVIADFPTGFEQESYRRLSSIALSGPRCGVHTIILRDTTQAIPKSAHIEDIISHSVRLRYKDGAFTWEDDVFKRFPLRVDKPPEEETLTRLMDVVGRAAKQAKRVEVPFDSIAPANGKFWSGSSQGDVHVPIGKSGAMRHQLLRLGVGVAQHALVAGKTGSGKSNLMHTIVTNLAMWYGPEEVEFYLVDFKKGVEFKAYASSQLPHARAIAVESDREFGVSVLQRVDAEMTRRGVLFRDAGAQEIGAYRDKTGTKLPRTILLIDEFQEFFSEDDKLAQEAAGLLDRVARQGRAFGVHMVLGSQTIGGSSGLPRSTLGQMAVRVALQCTEADSQIILGDNNSAARLLSRPGEAIYNDAGGLVEANSPFQIAFLPDGQRTQYLERVRALALERSVTPPTPIIFEGNAAAAIRKNKRLIELVERPEPPPAASTVPAYVGEPVAIKDPSAVNFRRQIGANMLMIGQQEESAVAIFAAIAASIAATQAPADAVFYLMDGTPADSPCFGLMERVLAALPQKTHVVGLKQVPEAIHELAEMLKQRQGSDAHAGADVYLMVFGLQRYRLLRRQKEDFSFSKSEEETGPKTDEEFAELLAEGPALGIHTLVWSDTPITVERTLERGTMRQFDHRILFQMSAADSNNLIDSPAANRLGAHRALLYSEEHGTTEKFRPYEVPDDAWIAYLAEHLKKRQGSGA